MEDVVDSKRSPMREFFENETLFVTGVTGFLGKVFLYKLFTAFPGLKEKSVYVLVRGQKELSAEKRFEKDILEDSLLFRGLLARHPEVRQKLRVIEGDIAKSKLGMSADDYEEVRSTCTTIIHMAATTNFNENLRKSVQLNVHGSRRILDLAKKMDKLRSVTHTSTCYVNATRHGSAEIREKIYPLNFDPYQMADKIMAFTEEEADQETPNIIGDHPNTYTFTKNMCEHIISEEKQEVPYCIVRPSIIGGSWKEPLPGWVDSFIGPAGLSLAAGLGALHAMPGAARGVMDVIPVDMVANALLAASYHTAVNPPGKRLPIYHISTGSSNPVTWSELASIVTGNFRRRPSNRTMSSVWVYFVPPRTYPALHKLFHVAPATVADARRVATGKKPMFVKKAVTLNQIAKSLEFFTSHEWFFAQHNLQALWESMSPVDAELFNFDTSKRNIDWEVYLVYFCEGLRRYLLKERTPEDERFFMSKL